MTRELLVKPKKCDPLPIPGPDFPGLRHRTVEPHATRLPMPRHLGNEIWLNLPDLSHRIASFLEKRSTLSCHRVELLRELFFLPSVDGFDDAPVNFEASTADGWKGG